MLDPDIQLFRAVVASGSLATAARTLGISAPMMSKRLARLEERLGASLIHRTTRRLALTAAGERFHTDVTELAAAADAAEARLHGTIRAPHGPLRVAAPTSFGRLHIAPALPAFLDAFPEVEIELDLSDAYVDLLGSGIDIALRIAAEVGAGLSAERLAPNRRLLCAAPAYLERRGMPAGVADLDAHHLLAAEGQLPWKLGRPGRAWTIEGRSRVRTNSSEVVRELALAGAGIALRSLWDVGPELADGRLVRVLPDIEGSAGTGILLVRPKATLVPAAVEAFAAHLRALFQPAPPWERP